MTHAFAGFGLHPALAQTVADLGYDTPTPIQDALVPPMLTGRDVIGQAQTGTGKTAAFALPLLHRLTPGQSAVQALVLVPTRELATQVASAIHTYGRALGVRVLPVYGGQPYARQVDRLRKGVEVVVGTPGRLLDLIGQGALDLSAVQTVVLDEADEMLSMGFAEDLAAILEATPAERQTALLSATLPDGIKKLAQRYLRDPHSCRVASEQRNEPAIEQRAYVVRKEDKAAAVLRLLETEPVVSAVVFAHTRVAVAEMAQELSRAGIAAEALSGEMTQGARTDTLRRFRDREVTVLVATDVAARGLDIDHISHVVNADVPRDPEIYVHRIGRTGRAGRSGVALALITPNQRGMLRRIESFTGQPIAIATLPTEAEIKVLREDRLAGQVAERLQSGGYDAERRLVLALLADGHDPMEVAAAALAIARADERPVAPITEVKGTREYAARDHGVARPARRADRASHDRPGSHESGMVRLSLDTGHADGVRPGQIVSALARHTGIPGNAIGKIRVRERHTLVDVPEGMAGQVLAQSGAVRFGKHAATVSRA